MANRRATALLAIGVCSCTAAALRADVVMLGPSQDNTLYQDSSGGFSNGAGAHFFCGETSTELARRGLVAFDIAGAIPAGSTIVSVTLTLHMSRTPAGAETVTLHRVRAAWGEGTSDAFGEEGGGAPSQPGDATWIHTFYPGQFWATPGGDFDSNASASLSVIGIAFYTWGSSGAMVADVQSWLDSPASNFGWMVIGDESFVLTTKRFDSRENIDPSVRPVLAVEFTPPCIADYNHDSFVDGIDYDAFNNDFESQDPEQQMHADINGDGFVDGIDYDLFNNVFEAGC